jgi:hypothetical protein
MEQNAGKPHYHKKVQLNPSQQAQPHSGSHAFAHLFRMLAGHNIHDRQKNIIRPSETGDKCAAENPWVGSCVSVEFMSSFQHRSTPCVYAVTHGGGNVGGGRADEGENSDLSEHGKKFEVQFSAQVSFIPAPVVKKNYE